MKTNILLTIVFVIVMQHAFSQNYQISFAGTGVSNSVDSVRVDNLTQGTSLHLKGADTLILVGIVGVGPADAKNAHGLKIFPNPMAGQGFLEFEATDEGMMFFEVVDIHGRKTFTANTMLQRGKYTVSITGLKRGIYTVIIKSEANFYTGKIVSHGSLNNKLRMSYDRVNSNSIFSKMVLSPAISAVMQFNDGDQLLLTGYSGIWVTVFPLIPTQSQIVSFSFVDCPDASGNQYPTVTIGTQVWMAANLNVGAMISGSTNQINNGIIEKYCYNNLETNCTVYGGLYQWDEMMQYDTTEGIKGICPTGWKIPGVGAWTTLSEFLGGTAIAGGLLKETGSIHWASPNINATNGSGFTALPGGNIELNHFFSLLSMGAYFWSSSQIYGNSANFLFLQNNSGDFFTNAVANKPYGMSVRCLLQ